MPELKPIDSAALDPLIAVHLQPGETVLWQAKPAAGTFASGGRIVGFALVLLAVLLPTGIIDEFFVFAPPGTLNRLVFNVGCLGAGLFLLYLQWERQAKHWSYALTDRRLLSVRRGTVIRDLPPENITRLEVRDGVVRWRTAKVRDEGEFEGKEGRRPGFYGLEDPAGVADLVRRWRDGFTERAQNAAEAAIESLREAGGQDGAADGDGVAIEAADEGALRRIVHPGTGLSLAVPRDWTLTSARYARPLAFLGIPALKRFGILGELKPYVDGEPWDQFVARGAPEIGLSVIVREGPIRANRQRWLNPPEAAEKRFRVRMLGKEPEYSAGDLTGFAVLNHMPERAVVVHFGQLAKPARLRLAWVGNAVVHVEFAAIVPEDRTELMEALETMIQSLRRT